MSEKKQDKHPIITRTMWLMLIAFTFGMMFQDYTNSNSFHVFFIGCIIAVVGFLALSLGLAVGEALNEKK